MGVLKRDEVLREIHSGRIEVDPFDAYARMGLMAHITAYCMQPGINNRQAPESCNISSLPLALPPGTRLCRYVFERTRGQTVYRGQFADQARP
jgi:dCTP deaminase